MSGALEGSHPNDYALVIDGRRGIERPARGNPREGVQINKSGALTVEKGISCKASPESGRFRRVAHHLPRVIDVGGITVTAAERSQISRDPAAVEEGVWGVDRSRVTDDVA